MTLRRAVDAFLLTGAMTLGLSLSGAASAQTVFSDNFSAEPGVTSLNYTGFANWNVTAGCVDIFGPYGSPAVDLDGTCNLAGTLQTKTAFALTPGSYELRFDLGKNGSATENVTASVGPFLSQLITHTGAIGTPIQYVLPFTVAAGGNAAITFAHQGADNLGFILDNVVLQNVTNQAVPEPGALAMLLGTAAGGGLLWLRRR
jgi:hypothetical protein